VKDFFSYMDSISPFAMQESWDNSGMLIGDGEIEVNRVALVLDITSEAVEYASNIGAELIISHHPVIFKPQKSFVKGNIAYEIASKGMSAICAHTCLDCADGGVNDVLCTLLDLQNVEIFPCEESENILRVGILPEKMTCNMLAAYIKSILGGTVRFCDTGKIIDSVAVCGGSGCDFKDDVIKAGIDAFITGDAGHHNFLDCKEAGLALFAAGHYETENPVISALAKKLREQFPDTDIMVIPQQSPISNL
ncbi:MAG: Nif3-like dinuclear metal center hexameric protein, partial [Clostridia bacterium]|nr:Nif3-like dinuclear metal center hexameric protein [Clostridia bacterium]